MATIQPEAFHPDDDCSDDESIGGDPRSGCAVTPTCTLRCHLRHQAGEAQLNDAIVTATVKAILTPDAVTLTADQLDTAQRIWDTHPGSGRQPSTAMCQLYAISEGGTLDQAAAALHTARNTTR